MKKEKENMKKNKKENLHYWYHYDNRGNPNQNYDDDPKHFENWKKENTEREEK